MTGLRIRRSGIHGMVIVAACALGCSGKSGTGDCADEDGDGYGQGAGCMGEDCNDSDGGCTEGACCPTGCVAVNFSTWQSDWGLGLTDTFHTDVASPPRVIYTSQIPDWDDVMALPTE